MSTTFHISKSYGDDLDVPAHDMLGLTALTGAMAELGVGADQLFEGTGASSEQLRDPKARLSHRQKIALFSNVQRLTPDPSIGLVAGQRQRISDFGVFGYGVVSSATFGEAIAFGVEHISLAGPVLKKGFRVEGDVAIFEGYDVMALGPLLPLATEFWFSSMQALISLVLEQPFGAYRLMLPYSPPPHAQLYQEVMRCPVEFNSSVMQWHFDAGMLKLPMPNANPITAVICVDFCDRMMKEMDVEPALVKAIKTACLDSGEFPSADVMADRLHLSARTLHRRLAELEYGYQSILDGIRMRLAIEYLERTNMSIDHIAERSGFSDVSNFRKAFKKWTGHGTANYRKIG